MTRRFFSSSGGGMFSFRGVPPRVAASCFVAPTAALVGDVRIGEMSSVWYNCVLRGDVSYIKIGQNTNVQDGSVIHVRSRELGSEPKPTLIGDYVTVGHSALLHACELRDRSFVGMQSVVMDFAVVETDAMVAAGSLVSSGTVVKSGELWVGRPAKKARDLRGEEIEFIRKSALSYVDFAKAHRDETKAVFISSS